jgi:hypothetical protein
MQDSLTLLEALRRVDRVRFSTWVAGADAGRGAGRVVSESPRSDTVVVRESGRWRPNGVAEVAFTNVYRWTALAEDALSLEHLRHGADSPVMLGSLVRGPDDRWSTLDAYRCGEDLYRATVHWHAAGVRLRWTVTGPKKDHRIESAYQLPRAADSELLVDR